MRDSELDQALTDRAAVTAGPNGDSGHVIAYSEQPMVCIQHFDGSRSWHVAQLVERDPAALTFEESERVRELSAAAPTMSHAALLDLVAKVKRDALQAAEAQA